MNRGKNTERDQVRTAVLSATSLFFPSYWDLPTMQAMAIAW